MLRADATPAPHAPAVPGPRQEPLPSVGAATRPATRREPLPASARDPFLDNAKYLAIVLVAVGHAWEPLREGSRTVTALYMLVYAFHMPVFAVISGCLSRGFEPTPGNLGRLLTRLALPYVVFETAYTLFTRWTSEDPDRPISLLDPLYLTWFLMALFIWRLTTPIWKALRRPLPVAFALAAAATLSPSIGDDLNLQRVLQFLPYFVLGLCLKPGQVRLVHRRATRLLAVPVFACALLLAYWAVPRMNYAWFFHNDSATALAAPAWYGPVMTLATFGCSITLTACFLAWVPRRRMPFTILGAGTLYGYLLHGFIAQGAKYADWYDAAWLHRPAGEVVVTLAAAAIMTALCTPPVQRALRCVLEPRMRWAFRPGSGP
ncbi:acyltransferase family protein [Streptomyces sp. UG1]|uniref:acyltransferase family protein n=1 Tax=Streptomyces sp. UG1 TaxID=3417652 RepID=UPI003CE86C1A